MRGGILDIVMPVISGIGNGGTVWIIIALIFTATKKYRIEGISMLAALLINLLISNVILKQLVARVRPCDINTAVELLIPRPADWSFPSGHASSSFAAAAVIFCRDKKIGSAALILAAVIAFSRLYLYVHYPSDIIAGIAVGITVGIFTRKLIIKIAKKITHKWARQTRA